MPTRETIETLLGLDPVAVVGCSRTPGKAAHDVPRYLLDHGYDILPVNPHADEIFCREAAASIVSIDRTVPLVCVFRPAEEVPDIVDAAIERGDVTGLWLQLGITHDSAISRAKEAGIQTVQDRCMKIEHERRRG